MSGARTVVWISGASSGIGAALAKSVPWSEARLFGVARRPPIAGEHVAADLSDPAAWAAVTASFDAVLGSGEYEEAMFLHFSGDGAPHGRASRAEPARFARSVLLNAAAGQILGQSFLHTCSRAGVRTVLVMCASPGALARHRGVSHYGAAKAALLHWTEVVREEEPDAVVLSVIPWATDTPMLHDAMVQDVEENPLSGEIAQIAARGELAKPEEVAAAVWDSIREGAPHSPLHVGPRPPEFQ
jgi:benzil reductase ((S)-benzoin forming)